MEEKEISGILRFQIKRGITNTYKTALEILEELKEDHAVFLAKLKDSLPEEHKSKVELANYWHDNRFQNLRGRILSVGNNSFRSIEEQLDNMGFKNE